MRISPVNVFHDSHDSGPQQLFNHVAGMLSDTGILYLHAVEITLAGEVDKAADMHEMNLRRASRNRPLLQEAPLQWK